MEKKVETPGSNKRKRVAKDQPPRVDEETVEKLERRLEYLNTAYLKSQDDNVGKERKLKEAEDQAFAAALFIEELSGRVRQLEDDAAKRNTEAEEEATEEEKKKEEEKRVRSSGSFRLQQAMNFKRYILEKCRKKQLLYKTVIRISAAADSGEGDRLGTPATSASARPATGPGSARFLAMGIGRSDHYKFNKKLINNNPIYTGAGTSRPTSSSPALDSRNVPQQGYSTYSTLTPSERRNPAPMPSPNLTPTYNAPATQKPLSMCRRQGCNSYTIQGLDCPYGNCSDEEIRRTAEAKRLIGDAT